MGYKRLTEKQFNDLGLVLSPYHQGVINYSKNLSNEVSKFYPSEVRYILTGDDIFDLNHCEVILTHDLDFRVQLIKEKYQIYCQSLWEFRNVLSVSKQYEIENSVEKPKNIGVLTSKKIQDWVNYYERVYNLMKIEKELCENKVELFRNKLSNVPDVEWNTDKKSGYIVRNGLKYSFWIQSDGYIHEKIEVHYKTNSNFEEFERMTKKGE